MQPTKFLENLQKKLLFLKKIFGGKETFIAETILAFEVDEEIDFGKKGFETLLSFGSKMRFPGLRVYISEDMSEAKYVNKLIRLPSIGVLEVGLGFKRSSVHILHHSRLDNLKITTNVGYEHLLKLIKNNKIIHLDVAYVLLPRECENEYLTVIAEDNSTLQVNNQFYGYVRPIFLESFNL